MGFEIDSLSGYCNSNGTYYSKRKPVNLPQDKYLDLPTYVSSLRHNGRIALIDSATGETITFHQLWRSIKSLAAGLAKLGIRKSDVVFLLSPNSIQFPIICTAIMSIGAIVTTTNPLNTAAEIAKQARDSAAVLAFTTPSLVDKLATAQLPIVLISSSSLELASLNDRNCISTMHNLIRVSNPADAPAVKIRQDDTATLLYSSGTTGASKGVICTHRNLISMLCILLSRLKLNCEYLYLCTVPMFHVYGLSAFGCGLLGSGSTIVVLSKFDVMEMLAAVEKYRVTYLPIVPPILLALTKTNIATKYDLSSLHTVICGGAPMSKESAEEFVSRFPSVSLLQVAGDSKVMIDWTKYKNKLQIAELHWGMQRIGVLRSTFVDIYFVHVYKTFNSVVDFLSKKALASPPGTIFLEETLHGRVFEISSLVLY